MHGLWFERIETVGDLIGRVNSLLVYRMEENGAELALNYSPAHSLTPPSLPAPYPASVTLATSRQNLFSPSAHRAVDLYYLQTSIYIHLDP